MLEKEQIPQIKKQVIEHINSTFPEDKKTSAIQQIESMGDTQFEEFLIQNKMVKEDGSLPTGGEASQCAFCSIVSGNIPSTKIAENKKAIAVLEINPISQAHTIIIPKEHIANADNLPTEATSLAKEISEKVKKLCKPKDIIIASANLFGHEIINVLPVYKDETLDSPKTQAKPEDLQILQEQLLKKETEIINKDKLGKKEVISEKNTWLPKRIP